MSLTFEERSEINRRNAANSTGPKSDEGKAKSRRNAIKHGLRSEVLALENEDAQRVAEREQAWFDHYQPASPAAVHLTTCCVRATLLADRVDRMQTALVDKQVRDARRDMMNAEQDAVDELFRLLPTDPAEAVSRLRRTAMGCRRLIERWDYLRGRLEQIGRWTEYEAVEAIRLQGLSADRSTFAKSEPAFLTYMYAALARGPVRPEYLAEVLFAPKYVPELYRGHFTPESHPAADECREALLGIVDYHLEPLRADERRHHDHHEAPDYVQAPDRASLVVDQVESRLLLRYMAESRTAFRNALRDLERTLKDDAQREPEPSEPLPPKEPKSDPKPAETAPKPASEPSPIPSPPQPPAAIAPEPPSPSTIPTYHAASYVDLPIFPLVGSPQTDG